VVLAKKLNQLKQSPNFKAEWDLGAQKANLCIFLLPGVNKSGFRINSKGWLEQSGGSSGIWVRTCSKSQTWHILVARGK
jgi:hypothetical protein